MALVVIIMAMERPVPIDKFKINLDYLRTNPGALARLIGIGDDSYSLDFKLRYHA